MTTPMAGGTGRKKETSVPKKKLKQQKTEKIKTTLIRIIK